jgi:hypothetical protein
MSLNAIKVENLRAKKTDYRVADGGGLYLLIRPNESKLWRYDYRLTDRVSGNIVRRTFAIGGFGLNGEGRARVTSRHYLHRSNLMPTVSCSSIASNNRLSLT